MIGNRRIRKTLTEIILQKEIIKLQDKKIKDLQEELISIKLKLDKETTK